MSSGNLANNSMKFKLANQLIFMFSSLQMVMKKVKRSSIVSNLILMYLPKNRYSFTKKLKNLYIYLSMWIWLWGSNANVQRCNVIFLLVGTVIFQMALVGLINEVISVGFWNGFLKQTTTLQVFRINFWLNINHINYSSKTDIFVWNANENM